MLAAMPAHRPEIVERDGCRFDCRHGLSALAQLLEAPSIEGVERARKLANACEKDTYEQSRRRETEAQTEWDGSGALAVMHLPDLGDLAFAPLKRE